LPGTSVVSEDASVRAEESGTEALERRSYPFFSSALADSPSSGCGLQQRLLRWRTQWRARPGNGLAEQNEASLKDRVRYPASKVKELGLHVGYCPICGVEVRSEKQAASAQAALCSERCKNGWRALVALRDVPNSGSVATLLLQRWRDGDWSVEPATLLGQLHASQPA